MSANVVSVCLLNIRSLTNKLSQFQSFVYTHDFCIFCLTETWLSDCVLVFSHMAGYVLYCKDRLSCGGGVLVAIKIPFAVVLFLFLLT